MSAAFVTAPAGERTLDRRGVPGRRPRADAGPGGAGLRRPPGARPAPAGLVRGAGAVGRGGARGGGPDLDLRGAGHLRGIRGGRRARRRDRGRRRRRPDRRQAGSRPGGATGRGAARAPRLGARQGGRRARLRGARRRLDGADPGDDGRRHGPRRQPLVPHAARGAVRADGLPRPHLLLRPGLSRLVLPGELRGPPRGPDPVLRPRHRLARAQPGLAVRGAAGGLVHRPAIRARPAGADRRLGGARLAEPGGVPGRRGAERHHGRRLRPGGRRDPGQRVRGPPGGRGGAVGVRSGDTPDVKRFASNIPGQSPARTPTPPPPVERSRPRRSRSPAGPDTRRARSSLRRSRSPGSRRGWRRG